MDYIRNAFDYFSTTAIKPKDRNETYFKKFLQGSIISPLVQNVEDREELTTGKTATAFYKEALNRIFERSKKFLDCIAEAYPDDKNIQYLQNAYKAISYKTAIYTGKNARKTVLHPAFFQFIDAMEALRRVSFLSLCTIWAGRGNTIFFSREQVKKYQSNDIVSMKVVDTFFFEPALMNPDNKFLLNYNHFMNQYYKGVDASKESTLMALNDGVEWLDATQKKAVAQAIESTTKQLKEQFPPTAENFASGVSFFLERVTDKLSDLYMDCTRGNAYIAPVFKGGLHPYFSYKAEQQEAYLIKLEELKQQRDKNVITILQDAEQPQNEDIILPAFLFFYQALNEILPPKKAEKELASIKADLTANVQKVNKVKYPVDKVNNIIWKDVERGENGQIFISTVRKGKNKELTVLTAINFSDEMEGVKISKKLTVFDKRICVAYSSLFNAGNQLMTLTQIHYAMGNTKRPADHQLQKINDSITKMATARFYLDNAIEVDKLKYNYPKFKYDGPFLPMERMTATINGKLSDAVIHAFREPPLMTFARERKQITTFNIKLLQSEISKTENNLAIEDYLIERIAETKNASGKSKKLVINTILLETLCREVGIKTRMQKTRAIKSIKIYLEHFKKNNFISDYKIDAEKITFYFEKKPREKLPNNKA